MEWFDVDKSGLAAMLERRGKSFAVFELVQNSWDSGAQTVEVSLAPIAGSPFATLIVEDDSAEGWADMSDAFTMFKRSRRAGDPLKRGRFCLGEKLALSLCRSARIVTTTGEIVFSESGRRHGPARRRQGTSFEGEIRLTRDELAEVSAAMLQLIPPADCLTSFNGTSLERPERLAVLTAKLPTEVADADGNLRRSMRVATIEAFVSAPGEPGDILEMGIPICQADWPWRLNVQQKVPLGMDRDSVTEAFRRALQVAAVNGLSASIDSEQSAKPWASEAIGDSRVSPDALRNVITARFGDRAVVAVPGDPVANATAEAMGSTVIHGGALSGDAWANVRKHSLLPTTSQAFPTPKPAADGKSIEVCPLCKQPVN